MANGMSSLYVGASGLQSAQTALNTTAHNLANINTTGYSRQQINFSDSQYLNVSTQAGISKYGLGVSITDISRIRNQFIDTAYRNGNSRLGYFSSQYNAVQEIEGLFGELQGVTYQSQLTKLRTAMEDVKNNPGSTVTRSSLVQNASSFITQSNAIYNGLKDYQENLNTKVSNTIDKINSLGNTIFSLNQQIIKIESAGQEQANDLRDQRDNALDELSQYINIDYYEQNNQIYVNAEGVPFVTANNISDMSSRTAQGQTLLIPTWPAYNKDVFKQESLSTGDAESDSGELKGLLLARGSVAVDYTDVPVKPNQLDYDLSTEDGRQKYTDDYNAYQQKQEYYNTYIEPSVILKAMVGIDKLVNEFVTTVNDVLCPETTTTTTTALTDALGRELKADNYNYQTSTDKLYKEDGTEVEGQLSGGVYTYNSDQKLYTDAAATTLATAKSYTYSILDMDKTSYGMDPDKTVGQELFSRNETERYIKAVDASGETIYVRNNLNQAGNYSDYRLGNIQMNSVIVQDTTKIPLTTKQGEEDIEKGQQMFTVWSKNFDSLNPEEYASGNIDTFYSNFVGDFATTGKVLNDFVNNQTTMVNGYNNHRLQNSGVSSDEELSKMIKFQQAYNAASRYVNVVSQMLEHLVTSLGH